ncbi:hypothetical protein BC830DRAFT_1155807 [Chytriomyces sp. MP71]|nr:hypothetical protein BC830DRAFT_1155807 [Chytriomyces sp. MP71]
MRTVSVAAVTVLTALLRCNAIPLKQEWRDKILDDPELILVEEMAASMNGGSGSIVAAASKERDTIKAEGDYSFMKRDGNETYIGMLFTPQDHNLPKKYQMMIFVPQDDNLPHVTQEKRDANPILGTIAIPAILPPTEENTKRDELFASLIPPGRPLITYFGNIDVKAADVSRLANLNVASDPLQRKDELQGTLDPLGSNDAAAVVTLARKDPAPANLDVSSDPLRQRDNTDDAIAPLNNSDLSTDLLKRKDVLNAASDPLERKDALDEPLDPLKRKDLLADSMLERNDEGRYVQTPRGKFLVSTSPLFERRGDTPRIRQGSYRDPLLRRRDGSSWVVSKHEPIPHPMTGVLLDIPTELCIALILSAWILTFLLFCMLPKGKPKKEDILKTTNIKTATQNASLVAVEHLVHEWRAASLLSHKACAKLLAAIKTQDTVVKILCDRAAGNKEKLCNLLCNLAENDAFAGCENVQGTVPQVKSWVEKPETIEIEEDGLVPQTESAPLLGGSR